MVQVRILEQPAAKIVRFRYKSERRRKSDDEDDETRATTAGIPGVHSQPPDKKTYPSIMIEGYQGWATVRVSCVVDVKENDRYSPHPHELVGTDCKEGFFEEWLRVTDDKYVKVFDKLAIRCVRKRDVGAALERRRKNRVDPFRTGIAHARDPNSINLDALRLCFEVFIHGAGSLQPLPPLVSEIIFDAKKLSKLKICYCSHPSAPVTGAGNTIVLLCDKIFTTEIDVIFFQTGVSGELVWQTSARSEFIFQHVAVVVKVPPYRVPKSRLDHKVWIKLWHPSADTSSTMSYAFRYTGIHTDPKYRPQEESELVTYSTRYGPIVTRKRAKRMHCIPPELFNIPTTYNFQGTSFPEAATQVSCTSTESEVFNLLTQGNPATVDRFYSVPETDHENRLFHREVSCPVSFVTGNSTVTAIPSTSLQGPSMRLENVVNIDQKQLQEDNSFVQPTFITGTEMEAEAIYPTLSNSVTSNVKCEYNESMDIYNSPLSSSIENQLLIPGTTSSQLLFPPTSTEAPPSSNESFCGLPSMDELMSLIRSVQNNEGNAPEDFFTELVNSANFPNSDDII